MAFTRDWNEATPLGSQDANLADDYIRYSKVDISDRLKNMVYGFIAGENTLSQHFQYIQFYEQASVAQPSAGYGRVYCKAVGGKCELFWHDEDGDEIQLTTGGNFGGCNLELVANMDLIGSSTSDITINTNKFTVAGATGNTVIAGTCSVGGTFTSTGVATVAKGSLLASSDAPTADAMIAHKKYVDDQLTAKSSFGSYTTEDDDSATLLKAHAYLANQDGIITAKVIVTSGQSLNGYIGATTDPAGAGDLVQQSIIYANGSVSITFPVASGKYWEVTTTSSNAVTIYWHPCGTLVKCTDQD